MCVYFVCQLALTASSILILAFLHSVKLSKIIIMGYSLLYHIHIHIYHIHIHIQSFSQTTTQLVYSHTAVT